MRSRARDRQAIAEALRVAVRSLQKRRRSLRHAENLQALHREAVVVLLDVAASTLAPTPLSEKERTVLRGLLSVFNEPGLLYEQLLAYSPVAGPLNGEYDVLLTSDNIRKRRGSYSTPDCLIDLLLPSALDPVLAPDLRLCDPACGGGRMLVAAAHRLANHFALPFRDVTLRCVFGVDRDPLAVTLCRRALWHACGDPELPLSAFDDNIRCGNSLIGAMTPQPDPDRWAAQHLGYSPLSDLKNRHSFFHWPNEFPFPFDVVLCNPPWEHVKHQQKERAVEESRFLRSSGRFPLSARGDLNYYGPFVELCRQIISPIGRIGLIVPSGIATDDSMKALFQSLTRDDLLSWYDFHNRERLFPDVQGNCKFGLLTLGRPPRSHFRVAAQLAHPADLDQPGRVCTVNADLLALVHPNTLHCPTFTSSAHAALVEKIHCRFPVMIREGNPPENPWDVRPWTMFHMTKDAPRFHRRDDLHQQGAILDGNEFHLRKRRFLPLWEAKLVAPFTCRAATFEGVDAGQRYRTHARTVPLDDTGGSVIPRYWIAKEDVEARAGDATWHLGFRNAISTVADSRSLIAAVVPGVGVGNSLPLLAGLDAPRACLLLALLNSFVLDYVLRQKASGGNLNFHVLKQLPVPPPSLFDRTCPWHLRQTLGEWASERVLRLVYNDDALREFARECGYQGQPFRLDESERYRLRDELDAACFHIYGLSREEVVHVLDTFEVLRRKETKQFGKYRSADEVIRQFDNHALRQGQLQPEARPRPAHAEDQPTA